MNLTQIARGWYNFINATPAIKILMETRLRVCDNCEHKEQLSTAGITIINTINHNTSLYKCGSCHCPLAPKTADPQGRCPLGKWH